MVYPNSNNYDLFDAEPLSLSDHGGGLDDTDCCFDFTGLDDSARAAGLLDDSARVFADSNNSDNLEGILNDTKLSADLDRIFAAGAAVDHDQDGVDDMIMAAGAGEFDSLLFDKQEANEPTPLPTLSQPATITSQQQQPTITGMLSQVQTVKTKFNHGYNCVRSKARRRYSQPAPYMVQEIPTNVNDCVAPYNHEKYQKSMHSASCNDIGLFMKAADNYAAAAAGSSGNEFDSTKNTRANRRAPKRRASCDDFIHEMSGRSLQRRVTIDSSTVVAPTTAHLFGSSADLLQLNNSNHGGNGTTCSSSSNGHPFQYHEALQKLAESMQRTELSRRQLIMQRTIQPQKGCERQEMSNTVKQQTSVAQRSFALSSAQHQLHQRVAGNNTNYSRSNSIDSMMSIHSEPPHIVSPAPTDRTYVMEAFFSGSRGTLTNGLEHSRRQLQMLSGANRAL